MDETKLDSSGQEKTESQENASGTAPAESPSRMKTASDGLAADDKKPKSQALLDIEAAGEQPDPEPFAKKTSAAKSAPQNLATIARFRWFLLFVLSLASIIVWTAEAQISNRPFNIIALGYLAATLILTIATTKFLRIPTRGGLAALLWAGTFCIAALDGPAESLFNGRVPAALPWGGLLILILLWMTVAVWRKVGRYKVIDIVLALIIVYAALSPLLALADNIPVGNVLFLKFQTLCASPAFITGHLPWFLWPMTVILALILPLCAILALWDQCSVLKRRGARHGGDFFLALAFLLLIPYGFLSYSQAVSEMPGAARALRFLAPSEITVSELPAPSAPAVTAPEPAEELEAALNPPAETTEAAAPPAASEPTPAPPAEEPRVGAVPPPAEEAAPIPAPAPGTEALERKITDLESELRATRNKLDALERRLEQLTDESAPAPRPGSPIPPPPDGPPAGLTEEFGLSSST